MANAELERYIASTPRSRALYEEARNYHPGGDSRTTVFYRPYPIFIVRGEGCRVWDADGTERLDFINNYTSVILGHANPAVVRAVEEQLRLGSCYAAPTEHQIRLARILTQRIPGVEHIRFTNSGTEATMQAIRAARAFTGRDKIAKCEGGYHGTHDTVEVSIRPPVDRAGDARRPLRVPATAGVPRSVLEEVIIIPFNDLEATRQIILEHRHELAAVIVEPVMGAGGVIPARPEYLQMLREVTAQNDILLIFDEVISFRVSSGGAQEVYGVTPDLTSLGKIIGGGMPIGAVGGRRDVMAVFDPTQGPRVVHGGTFNANPVTMVAGVATMEQLTPPVYARLNALGESLRQKLRSLFAELEVPAQVTGMGSLFNVHFTPGEVRTYRDTATRDDSLYHTVFLGLMNEGIFISPRLMGCLTTPMGEAEVDAFVEAMRRVVSRNLK